MIDLVLGSLILAFAIGGLVHPWISIITAAKARREKTPKIRFIVKDPALFG